jgi:hypothetical protein
MKKKLLVTCLAATFLVGCISAATVASYLPIFESALNGVLALVAPNASAAVTADESKINAAVTDLASAIGSAQGEAMISAKLGTVETLAGQLETDLGVSSNNDVKLAVAILDLSIGTYQAIVAKSAPATTTTVNLSGHEDWGGGAVTTAGAKPRAYATSSRSFKRQFNTLCKQYGRPELQMKLTLAEHLHLK